MGIAWDTMRLYIETTVPNFLFADDAPEKKAATEEFFKWLGFAVTRY